MPVDTAQLARFLIGKMLVRILAEGVAGGRIVETEAYSATPRVPPIAASPRAIGRFSSSAGTHMYISPMAGAEGRPQISGAGSRGPRRP